MSEKLSLSALSAFWGVGRSTAWRLVRGRDVPFHNIGKRIFVFKKDAENYVRKNTTPAITSKSAAAKIMHKTGDHNLTTLLEN